jgi:hypothetical protein
LLGSSVLFSVHAPKFAISFHSEWNWYIINSVALLSDRYMAPQHLFTSTLHYSVSSCKCFKGSPNHQNSTAVLVFTSTIHYSVSSCKCFAGSPDAQNRVYSMHKHSVAFTVTLQSSAFGHLPRQAQVKCSSCQTFAQYRVILTFLLVSVSLLHQQKCISVTP